MIAAWILRLALLASLSVSASAQVPADVFPKITTNDLNGRALTFPRDLPGETTLVLIAYQREQQAELDVWIDKLGLKKTGAPAWIEMPVIEDYGRFWRGFVDNGMRSGIVTNDDRARVFTVYGSRSAFRANLRLPGTGDVALLWVDRAGTIRHRAYGTFTEQKAASLREAIKAVR